MCMANNFIRSGARAVGSRYRCFNFLFIKLAKNDRIFYFCKAKVIVFNTNLEQGNYRVARNFCGGLFLRIGDFLSFARINFATRTDWFFSLAINFCDFQKVPSTQHWWCFRFLLSTSNINSVTAFVCKTSYSLYTVLFLNKGVKVIYILSDISPSMCVNQCWINVKLP